MRGLASPAQGGDGHHQPQGAEGHTPDLHPPCVHTQALPEGSRSTWASPVNTQPESGSAGEGERGRGLAEQGLGCQGTRNRQLRTFLGAQRGPTGVWCLPEAPSALARVPLSHRTSLMKHKFKDRMSKNFKTQHPEIINPQVQGLSGRRALGGCTATCPRSQP